MGGHEVDGSHDPTDGQREEGAPAGREFGRRSVLKGIAGAGAFLGAGRSVDSILLGYGVIVGTNLREQDLGALADEGFHPGGRSIPAGTHEIHAGPREVRIAEGGVTVAAFDPVRTDPGDAEAIGAEHGLGGATSELAHDLGTLAAGDYAFEFHGIDGFFERVRGAEARPYTAGAMRRWHRTADPDRVERFVGTSPGNPGAVVRGLASGFREHAHYDVARYLAGAVQDNVIMGAADLRAPFREPVGFGALLADDGGIGMFCYEFTHRSIEALHAVPAPDQAVPVIGARIIDDRHKHVYTGVASVVRDGGLRVPMTFVDYTHSTMYDDASARGLLGEGVGAYDDRHRATAIEWTTF